MIVHIENSGAKISLPSSSWTARLAPSRVPSSSIVGEQVVGGVAGEHVGQARLDADAEQGQPARPLPLPRHGELLVAELDADLGVGLVGVPLGQAHRHVEVVGTGRQRAPEDRHDEPRVDGVEHVRRAVLARQRRHGGRVRGVDLGGDEPRLARRVVRARRGDGRLGARRGRSRPRRAARRSPLDGDPGGRVTDATGADHQDPHGSSLRLLPVHPDVRRLLLAGVAERPGRPPRAAGRARTSRSR